MNQQKEVLIMKRMLCLLFSLILMASVLMPVTVTASNDVPYDSTDIKEDVKAKYDTSETTLILKYKFSSEQKDSFSGASLNHSVYRDVSSFNDLFGYLAPENYFVYWNDGRVDTISLSAGNGHVITAKPLEINANSEVVFPYSAERISLGIFEFYRQDNLSQHLGEDVTILQKYFVHEAETTNSMILYVTNKGNYVYFDNDQIDPCLFSEAAFFDYLHLVYELNSVLPDGEFEYDVCNLSAYTLNSPDFVPNANNIPWVPQNLAIWFCVGIILVVSAVIIIAVVVYRKKIKNHNPYEERQGTRFDGEFVFYHNIDDRADSMNNQPARMN